MDLSELILGIDAGGSKTVAWLAERGFNSQCQPIGRAEVGGANPQAHGWPVAIAKLEAVVGAVFHDAGISPGTVFSACIALAGGDRPRDRQRIHKWAEECQLAHHFQVVNDALPVLAAGTTDLQGIALISGTGSFALGRDWTGSTVRAGGLGYLLGDEGSGYAIGLAGLRHTALALDGRAALSPLCRLVQESLGVTSASEMISIVYPRKVDRRSIAAFAPMVLQAAEAKDEAANCIVDNAAKELGKLVKHVAQNLTSDGKAFSLALGGGLLVHSHYLRELIRENLSGTGPIRLDAINVVPEPVVGTLLLCQEKTRS